MIGKLLDGRYKILQLLGSGGFSQTYLAQDTRRPGSPTCVVKQLKPNTSNPNSLQISRRLFRSEAETLERLGNHGQIPRLLAYFEEEQDFYLVQEYIEGHLLTTELKPEAPLDEQKVIELLKDVLGILAFVHDQGVIHRDVKPDNLIRRWEDNRLVLVDFGAVKKIWNRGTADQANATSVGTIIGTPGYMATEQGRGKPRPSSDIYALGMIAIQALTGRLPMELTEDSTTGDVVWKPYANISPGLAAIIDRMTCYHFKDRFQTAGQALAALEQHAMGLPPDLSQVGLGEAEAPSKREETFYGQPLPFLQSQAPASSAQTPPPEAPPRREETYAGGQPLVAPTPALATPPPRRPVPEPARPTTAVAPPAERPSRLPVLAGVGAVAVIAVGALALFVLRPQAAPPDPAPAPPATTATSVTPPSPASTATAPSAEVKPSSVVIPEAKPPAATVRPTLQPNPAKSVATVKPAVQTNTARPIVPPAVPQRPPTATATAKPNKPSAPVAPRPTTATKPKPVETTAERQPSRPRPVAAAVKPPTPRPVLPPSTAALRPATTTTRTGGTPPVPAIKPAAAPLRPAAGPLSGEASPLPGGFKPAARPVDP